MDVQFQLTQKASSSIWMKKKLQQIENLAVGKSFVSPFFLFFSFLYTAVTLYVYLLRLLSRKVPTFASSNDDGAGSLHVEPVFETFMTKNQP